MVWDFGVLSRSTIQNLKSKIDMKHPLYQQLEQLATDRWARQGIRTLLRAAWLSACVWCIGLGGHLVWGWPLRYDLLGALALAIIGIGVVSLLRPKMSVREVARRLDRRFQLNEQLATAIEVIQTQPPPTMLSGRLMVEAGQTTVSLQRRISRRQKPPWSEVIALLALGFVVLGLLFLAGIGRINQELIGAGLPPLPPLAQPQSPDQPAEEPFTPPQGQQPGGQQPGAPDSAQQGQPGATDPQSMSAIADALRDQSATRPAADALDQGDTAGAAQQLRELADQAGQLSQQARSDLANELEGAADQLQQSNPELADQLRESASGLEQGGQEASEALDDLASAVEGLGQQGQQGQSGQGDQQGQQGQPGQGDQQGQVGQQGQPGQQGQLGQGDQQGQGQSGQGDQQSQSGQENPNGQGGAGNGAGNGVGGEQRQAAQSGRLGVEGQPVELDAQGAGQNTNNPSEQTTVTEGTSSGFTQGGESSDQTVRIGADPLRVPLDERDVVQEYFAP